MIDPSPQDESPTSTHARRARAGDVASVRWLVERLSPALLAQARFRLHGWSGEIRDPERVVGDVWLHELPNLPEPRPGYRRFVPVLLGQLGTALERRISELRARERLSLTTADVSRSLPDAMRAAVRSAVRSGNDPAIQRFIEGLDREDRAVLILRAVERRTDRSIAALTGVHSGAVAAQCRAVLERLGELAPDSVFTDLDCGR